MGVFAAVPAVLGGLFALRSGSFLIGAASVLAGILRWR
jgi:hypothetical protein